MKRPHDFQKYEEMNYGKYFVQWANDKYGLDYQSYPNPIKDSQVDVYAESENGLPKLNLQMVTSDGPTEHLMRKNIRRLQRGENMEAEEVKGKEWITSVLDEKIKKYPNSLKQELILIIQGFMPTPTPEEVKQWTEGYGASLFKGIYYVSLPVHSSTGTENEINGFVVTIKDPFS